MWLDGKLVIDHWRQGWLTDNDQIKVHLEAGHHYAIKIESGGDEASTMQLTWKTPTPDGSTSLWSEVGDGEDYYFVYGPALDQVIAGYRQLTGQASMMPEWAFGLWQSRQRYETASKASTWWRNSAAAPFLSTTSCRTGNTGRATPGVRMSSIRRAFPIPPAGSRPSTSGTRT